jgi:type II secretory pathway component GspD/PulD (secretin)
MRVALTFLALAMSVASVGRTIAQEPSSGGQMVTVEVTIAEFTPEGRQAALDLGEVVDIKARLAELEQQGQVKVFTRAHLTTLDGSKAMIQIGEQTAVATGQQFTGRRGEGGGPAFNTSYSMQQTGTMFQVRPRVEADGSVVLEFSAEKSRIVQVPQTATEEGQEQAFQPPKTTTMTSQTTLRIPPGQTVLVGGLQAAGDGESGQVVLLVSATATAMPEGASAAQAAPADLRQLSVYHLQAANAASAAEILGRVFEEQEVRVAVDERTNSILVHGSADVQHVVAALLERLDRTE